MSNKDKARALAFAAGFIGGMILFWYGGLNFFERGGAQVTALILCGIPAFFVVMAVNIWMKDNE